MKILYLIPARKGSKGLPGKNTKQLGNKPLIAYSIDFALLNKKYEDELCISTNDTTVVEVANSMGVNIPFIRPEELSNDTASSYDVILHALNYYEEAGKIFDAVLLLQPTSPFRTQSDLINLINEFDEDTDMVVSVKLAKENPYFTLFEESQDGLLQKSKEGKFVRRQDCPPTYAFNGSMYLINARSINKFKINEFKRIKKILMPEERSIDIDIMADFILAEYYLSKL
jgi:CMP-N,N'-diacetyllegionaminic acid synthase